MLRDYRDLIAVRMHSFYSAMLAKHVGGIVYWYSNILRSEFLFINKLPDVSKGDTRWYPSSQGLNYSYDGLKVFLDP